MAARNEAAPTAAGVPFRASSSPSQSARSIRPGTPKGKAAVAPDTTSVSSNTVQLRAELASALKARSNLESKLSAVSHDLSALKVTNEEQTKRIAHLEKIKDLLERRSKDRADELKGKGSLMDSVQNEMVALNLELNMVQQENDRLKKENEALQHKWMEQMEKERKRADEERQQFAAKRR